MILHHHGAEILYLLAIAFVLRQAPGVYFGDPAFGRVLVKRAVRVRCRKCGSHRQRQPKREKSAFHFFFSPVSAIRLVRFEDSLATSLPTKINCASCRSLATT